MQSKANQKTDTAQPLIAGILKKDSSVEFFGIHETMEVRFIQNGQTHDFGELRGLHARLIVEAYENDPKAKEVISSLCDDDGNPLHLTYKRQLELYTYFCYGDLDGIPDIIHGTLSPSENFRHRRDCVSMQFGRKNLHINGEQLKEREITMIDCFFEDLKDDVVADILGITITTLNQHKKTLFNKAGVQTKTALMIKATQEHIPML